MSTNKTKNGHTENFSFSSCCHITMDRAISYAFGTRCEKGADNCANK